MDNRPIAVFDSGVGGLMAVREIRRLLPGEDIIFLGDGKYMPYGDRPAQQLRDIGSRILKYLEVYSPKLVAVACGTMSSVAMEQMRKVSSCPVIGIIAPAAQTAAKTTVCGRVGVIATTATVNSGAFETELLSCNNSISVYSKACPKLAPMAEAGITDRDDEELKSAVREYLTEIREAKVDALILGCTHYPLVARAISDFMGSAVRLIDSDREIALAVKAYLERENRFSSNERGECRYFTTGDVEKFAGGAKALLGEDISELIEFVDLPFSE